MTPPLRRGPREGLLVVVLAVVAVVALAQSWNGWLDPIIDTGRDLYVSEQLAHGAKLYRDLRYQYPPLAPYLLAAVAGPLAAFTAVGIAQSLAIAGLLWFMLRGPAGFAAALLFLSLSFTGASTWGANFIFPYAYAVTFGVLLMIAALAAFVRQRPWIAIACLVGASWCKVEYAIGAALIVTALLIARRIRIRDAAAYVIAMLATGIAAYAYFGPAMRANLFAPSLTQGDVARAFFRDVAGLSDWQHNVLLALGAATAVVLIAWLFRSGSRLAVPAVLVAAIVFDSDSFFRGWALLQVVAFCVAFRDRRSPLIYYAVFAIASTLRIPLRVAPVWYGFALVVPVYALVAYVLFASPWRSSWWMLLIAVICARDLVEQHQYYARKIDPIVTPRGTLYDASPDRARILSDVIRSVRGPTLAVFPEGATINYLTRTPSPLSFYMFTPPETADPTVESAVLDELRRHPPADIVILTRDVREYGFRAFGVDYDRAIMSYITDHYRVVQLWRSPRFSTILVHRAQE